MDHVFYEVERSYGFHANTYAVTYKSIEYMNGIRYPIDPERSGAFLMMNY